MSSMDAFEQCHVVNDLMEGGNESAARDELIKLLHEFKVSGTSYSPIVNHLIRRAGLYPYLELNSSSWQDRLVHEAFKVDVGGSEKITLHREQSFLLHKLLDGESIAVSAPTSFGKSFVIDSFISVRRPKNIAIIVPTIALTDETRRRLQLKFGSKYKIITTADQTLADNNILIFPPERAIQYAEKLESLDILIIDEFYKASHALDKERSPALLKAILRLSKLSKQRYFLAPNISSIKDNVFTKGMEFCNLDFNTVFLKKYDLHEEIGGDEVRKSEVLLKILSETTGKTLIYAGTYSNIDRVTTLLIADAARSTSPLLEDFSYWLAKNYDPNWPLTQLVKRGAGIHNGQLHRSLSQLQIRLFEEVDGLQRIVSTSSIIEGVNTSAQNVVLWSNRSGKGTAKITDFSYKNIIGRGGRMLRHFVGNIYILDKPPVEVATELKLSVPDELLGGTNEEDFRDDLTADQIAKIVAYKEELVELVGDDGYKFIRDSNSIQTTHSGVIKDIVTDLHNNPNSWNGLKYLNSERTGDWDRLLYKILRLQPGVWGASYTSVVEFIKILSGNWRYSIPELLAQMESLDIGVDDFFKLERTVTFRLPGLLGDICVLQEKLLGAPANDISPFIAKVSSAFLPKVVYQLEEYGLPRSISKIIHRSRLHDFEDEQLDIHAAINKLLQKKDKILAYFNSQGDRFELYILNYFYEGITHR